MMLLLLRVTLAPLLVAGASLAQRRWGQAVGGRLVGLPLTSIPLLLLLALSNGPRFTGVAATASLAGGVAQAAWCLAYAVIARRRSPVVAVAGATGVFAVLAVAVAPLPLGPVAAALVSAAALVVALAVWPAPPGEDSAPAPTGSDGHDLAVRMSVAAAFTFALTESASSLGARGAGLVGALPLLTIVLAVATHRRDGPAATSRFLHGVMASSYSVVACLVVLAVALPRVGIATAFAASIAAALAAQVLTTRRSRARLSPTRSMEVVGVESEEHGRRAKVDGVESGDDARGTWKPDVLVDTGSWYL